MSERDRGDDRQGRHRLEDLIRAFEQERAEAEELHRRHTEETRRSHTRDRQVLIERRRVPR